MTKQLRDVTPLYGTTCRADNGFTSEEQQSLQGLSLYAWDELKREAESAGSDFWEAKIFGLAKIKSALYSTGFTVIQDAIKTCSIAITSIMNYGHNT